MNCGGPEGLGAGSEGDGARDAWRGGARLLVVEQACNGLGTAEVAEAGEERKRDVYGLLRIDIGTPDKVCDARQLEKHGDSCDVEGRGCERHLPLPQSQALLNTKAIFHAARHVELTGAHQSDPSALPANHPSEFGLESKSPRG